MHSNTISRSIVILFSHLRLCLQNLFHSGFLAKILHLFPISLMRTMYPAHLICNLIIIITIGETRKLWRYSLCSWSRDTSVCIETMLGDGRPGVRVRFPEGPTGFSVLHNFQTGPGSNWASYTIGTRCCFPKCKAAETWYWPLTSGYLTCLHGVMQNYLSPRITLALLHYAVFLLTDHFLLLGQNIPSRHSDGLWDGWPGIHSRQK